MAYRPSLRDIIAAYLRRKSLFMLLFGGVSLIGGLYLLVKQPLYLSGASLVLHFDTQTVPDIDQTLKATQLQGSNEHREILYSDADILHSPAIIRDVVKTVGLARLYPAIATGPGDEPRKLDLASRVFASNFVVDVGLQSDVLNVSFLHPDPALARDAVQSLLDRFFAQEADVYANPQLQFAESESKASRDKLTAAQNALADFKSNHQIADLQQQVTQLLRARTDVESRFNIAHGRLLESEKQRDALQQLLSTVPQNVTSSAMGEQYHTVDSAEAALDDLKAKRSRLASVYQPGSDVFQQLDAQIASLSSAASARNREARSRSASEPNVVYQNVKTDYLRAAAAADSNRQPEQVLHQQLDQINQHLSDLEAAQNHYDDLTRAVQILGDTYRTLAIRYETARVEANRNAQKISAAVVISAPMVPNEPARPRRKLIALATLVAALLVGIAGVQAIEAFDDRFHTPRDVTRALRLPVLATFTSDG
jgi:succinoglycan biosynthesis transport protein ExoP